MALDRARIIEGIITAGIGGAVTAAIIAAVPTFASWLVRPSTPPGQIAAFEGPCPTGWDIYTLAGGRVIVGAGSHKNKDGSGQILTAYQPLDIGGEELHRLTIDELPAHSHTYQHWDTKPHGNGLSGSHSHQDLKEATTSQVGQGKPHNNLQPYIALQFCKSR